MKASELRIGNIVTHDDYSDGVFTVKSLFKSPNQFIVDTIGGKNGTWTNPVELVNPIPLTEEWLLKFGFEKRGREFTFKYVTVRDEQTGVYSLDYINTNGLCHSVYRYVHELQNIFHALTGQELTFNS